MSELSSFEDAHGAGEHWSDFIFLEDALGDRNNLYLACEAAERALAISSGACAREAVHALEVGLGYFFYHKLPSFYAEFDKFPRPTLENKINNIKNVYVKYGDIEKVISDCHTIRRSCSKPKHTDDNLPGYEVSREYVCEALIKLKQIFYWIVSECVDYFGSVELFDTYGYHLPNS